MQEAIAKVQKLDTANDDTPIDDIFLLVEKIGDIVFETFGPYSAEWFQIRDELKGQGDSTFISLSTYKQLYKEDDGEILQISDMEYGSFICPEFAAVTAVLCHIAGLHAFVVRAPLALGMQYHYEEPFFGEHSTVLITNVHGEIYVWLKTRCRIGILIQNICGNRPGKSLTKLHLDDFLKGQPFVGVGYMSIYTLFMGNPVGLSDADYFEHSQYEGLDYTIKEEAIKRLFQYYREDYMNTIENSSFFLIKKMFDLPYEKGVNFFVIQQKIGSESMFQISYDRYSRSGFFVAEWLTLQRRHIDMDRLGKGLV